jgi:hypothetical protein
MMYSLWKTQGITAGQWREDLQLGAVDIAKGVKVHVSAEGYWRGVLKFDLPRHRVQMGMPLDYPRINQFPEWFTVEETSGYHVRIRKVSLNNNGSVSAYQQLKVKNGRYSGKELVEGLPVQLKKGK